MLSLAAGIEDDDGDHADRPAQKPAARPAANPSPIRVTPAAKVHAYPDPGDAAEDIAKCESLELLDTIGERIRASNFLAEERKNLVALYAEQRDAIRNNPMLSSSEES
jgi:hypothetical protein